MSNKSRSSSRRVSKASKQPGLLETLTRAGKRTAVVDEEDEATGTVIDLDSDDPVSQQVNLNFMNKIFCIILVLQRVINIPE